MKDTTIVFNFLALVSDRREVRVLATSQTDYRRLYRSHMQGEHIETASFFERKRAKLFLLESKRMSRPKAVARSILWEMYFKDCGFTLLRDEEVECYRQHPHPCDAEVDDEIRGLPITDLCADERDLAREFVFKVRPHTIKIEVSPEELKQLRFEAANLGLRLQDYCAKKFACSKVEAVKLDELLRCELRCQEAYRIAESCLRRERLAGVADPSIEGLTRAISGLRRNILTLMTAISRFEEGRR